MFLVLWEYDVKPGFEARFERVYGPDGDWAQLFRLASQYRETRLLRDLSRPNAYVTLDVWDSQTGYDDFRQKHRDAYQLLDNSCEVMTLSGKHLACFAASS